MSELDLFRPLNPREEMAVSTVLSLMRGDWDGQDFRIENDMRPAFKFGQQFPFGVRDMGVTFTLHVWCNRPRDLQSGEVL